MARVTIYRMESQEPSDANFLAVGEKQEKTFIYQFINKDIGSKMPLPRGKSLTVSREHRIWTFHQPVRPDQISPMWFSVPDGRAADPHFTFQK